MKRNAIGIISSIAATCLITVLLVSGCKERTAGQQPQEPVQPDAAQLAEEAYSEIITFINKGFECHWEGISPDDMGLSSVLNYESPFSGSAEKDLNGDGIPELLIGEGFEEDGSDYMVYDIFTFDKEKLVLKHLLKGGERDWCTVNGKGIIIENGSNSAFDSFRKSLRIEDAELVEIDGGAEDDLMNISFEKFSDGL